MSEVSGKNKKMTFQEYESKFTTKPSGKMQKKTEPTVRQKNVQKGQYAEKKFSPNPINIHGSAHETIHNASQENTFSEASSHYFYETTTSNIYNQTSQRQLLSAQNSILHEKSSEEQRQSGYSPDKKEQVSKIDLIFQKQPEDVQRKLRTLLLNYNAVMQYNQSEDKFQVDLLLPFGSIEQKQKFVEKFIKTRQHFQSEIKKGQFQAHKVTEQTELRNGSNNQNISSQSFQRHYNQPVGKQKRQIEDNYSNSDSDGQKQQIHSFQQQERLQNQGKKNKDEHPVMKKHHPQILTAKKDPNQIDFYALNLSLDNSIQRALSFIRQQNLISKNTNNVLAQKNTDQHQSQSLSLQIDLKSRQMQIQRPDQDQTLPEPRKYQQGPSQIQSEISQGLKPSVPNTFERNIQNTPSAYEKNAPQPSKQIHSFSTQEQNTNSHFPSQKNSVIPQPSKLYQSPTVPQKIQKSNYFQKSNPKANEILIQDQFEDVEYFTPARNPANEQYESTEQDDIEMIVQTSQQHEQDRASQKPEQQFISPKDYQQFLKKKLNMATMNMQSSLQKPVSPEKSLTFTNKSGNGPGSSLRRKYSQFLSKNHKKLQNFYMRIGKQMKKTSKRPDLQKNYASNTSNQSRKDDSQILVLDDDDSINSSGQIAQENVEQKQIHDKMLQDYKKRIVLQNQSMSSQDKVRYFRYLAKHAKALYIDYIRAQSKRS